MLNIKKKLGKPVGDTVLFFGCRKKNEDFLYEEEFQESIDEGLLTVNEIFTLRYIEMCNLIFRL